MRRLLAATSGLLARRAASSARGAAEENRASARPSFDAVVREALDQSPMPIADAVRRCRALMPCADAVR